MFPDFVLGLFIPVAIGMFFVMRPLQAALLVALGGDMFLPVGPSFHIPFLPTLSKVNLPYLCILIGCLLRCPGRVTRLPKEKWFLVLSLLALVGGAGTGLTNSDLLPYGSEGRMITAMTFKDGMFSGVSLFIEGCLTFYLGYSLVRDTESVEKVLAAFGIAGLVYAPFAIIEMRMSPQLNRWVYGMTVEGDWGMTMRWGGYRPTIFMPHGLAVARFFLATTLALFVLAKHRRRLLGVPLHFLALFQLVVLVMCRSTGAIVLALVGVLFIELFKPKMQLLFAGILALATVLYPLLRSANMFPVTDLLDAAGALQADRQQSLGYRFMMEDILLEHARERLLFGWGTYGRNLVYDSWGHNITTCDGYWIIVLGTTGVAGFLVPFGNLVWPVIVARRRLRKHGTPKDCRLLAGVAVILVLLTVDLIPNGLWGLYPFLLAGVLTRRLRELRPTNEMNLGAIDQASVVTSVRPGRF
jgi:hypothetical protein